MLNVCINNGTVIYVLQGTFYDFTESINQTNNQSKASIFNFLYTRSTPETSLVSEATR